MTASGPPPVFLERRSYRRRRMMDALRLLPVLGVLLWLLPLFWPSRADRAGSDVAADTIAMSSAIIYVFVVWVGLIIIGAALWWALGRHVDPSADVPPPETR